jgi:hypothetical protein
MEIERWCHHTTCDRTVLAFDVCHAGFPVCCAELGRQAMEIERWCHHTICDRTVLAFDVCHAGFPVCCAELGRLAMEIEIFLSAPHPCRCATVGVMVDVVLRDVAPSHRVHHLLRLPALLLEFQQIQNSNMETDSCLLWTRQPLRALITQQRARKCDAEKWFWKKQFLAPFF